MLYNHNPWVDSLLTWHGFSLGGVRVPFQDSTGNPLGMRVDTPLLKRLECLARSICLGEEVPRWIFLVGGPGNGKSAAVEAFVEAVDRQLELAGRLVSVVREAMSPRPLTPRKVLVRPLDIGLGSDRFRDTVTELVLVQDASAVADPLGRADAAFLEDIRVLLSSTETMAPVFICCINRGILARALTLLREEEPSQVPHRSPRTVIQAIASATSPDPSVIGVATSCWPLDQDRRFACWPLDSESLFEAPAISTESSPMWEVIAHATEASRWELAGRCLDCASAELCPFRQNAGALRDPVIRQAFIELMRHGELALGRRWNFRDAFSLCSALLVGYPGEFSPADDACSWVHDNQGVVAYSESSPQHRLRALWSLATHLWHHALFPGWPDVCAPPSARLRAPITTQVLDCVMAPGVVTLKKVRQILVKELAPTLDPAHACPREAGSILRQVEDECAQSVQQGSRVFGSGLHPSERLLVQLLAEAEAELDRADPRMREEAVLAGRFLKRLATAFLKRPLGLSRGEYRFADELRDYRATLRSEEKLSALEGFARRLLAPDGRFRGSLLRVFGQPETERSRDVVLATPSVHILSREAPVPTPTTPSHGYPVLVIENCGIALTFDVYLALKKTGEGCQTASFTPAMRAALDRVRSVVTSQKARERMSLRGGTVEVCLGDRWVLRPAAGGRLTVQEVNSIAP